MMMDMYTAKAWSHSAILVTGYCLDLDPAVSSKPKWLGTRSPNSLNALASNFCTRLCETGGIVEPGGCGTGGIVEPGGCGLVALPRVVANTLTWLRYKPAEVRGGGWGYTVLLRYYGNLSIGKGMV